MEFPNEILAIIKDFSRPITRPDWRKLRKMTSYNFHSAVLRHYNQRRYKRVIYNFVSEYSRRPQDKFIYFFCTSMDYNRHVSIVQLRLKSSRMFINSSNTNTKWS